MMSSTYSVNGDASAEKFPVDKSGFIYWKMKMESFLEVRELFVYVESKVEIVEGKIAPSESQSSKSEVSDDEKKEKERFEKERKRTYNIILQTLSPEQLMLMSDVKKGDAYSLWKKLNDVFGTVKTTDSLVSIMNQLGTLSKNKNESVKEYLGRVGTKLNQLRELGQPQDDSMKKYYVVAGLRNSHDWRRTAELIGGLDKDDSWTVDQLEQYLISEDNARSLKTKTDVNNNNNNNNNNAYGTYHRGGRGGRGRGRGGSNRFNNNNRNNTRTPHEHHVNATWNDHAKNDVVCYKCGNAGHKAPDCYSKNRDNKPGGFKCYKCGEIGHKAADCKNNCTGGKGNVAQSTHSSSSSSTDHDGSSYTCVENESMSSDDVAMASRNLSEDWILDTGATRHYTCNKNLLYNMRTVEKSEKNSITTANGYSYYTVVGDADLYINNEKITLKDVAYVSDFKSNLISILVMIDRGAHIECKKTCAVIYGKRKGEKYIVPRVGNLYKIVATNHAMFVESDEVVNKFRTEMRLMHVKSGHVNYNKLYDMLKADCLEGVSNQLKQLLKMLSSRETHVSTTCDLRENNANNAQNLHEKSKRSISMKLVINSLLKEECVGCLKGKMHRLPMKGKIDYGVNDIMDLWCCDTVGPIKIPTVGGSMYALNIIDARSKKFFTQLKKQKGDIDDGIINEITEMQTQTGKTLKRFHSDHGTEIVTNKLKEFMKKNGTVMTESVPYTPQHNGLIERANQTLFESAKCMMHHCSSYLPLWGEAVMCAKYILNRTVTAANRNETPFEIWEKKKPNVKNYHVFGSDVYYFKNEKYRENKLDTASIKGIFVGYDKNRNDYYRVYDVEKDTVITVRDVKIFDNSFNAMKKLVYETKEEVIGGMDDIFKESDALPDNISAADIEEMFSGENNEKVTRDSRETHVRLRESEHVQPDLNAGKNKITDDNVVSDESNNNNNNNNNIVNNSNNINNNSRSSRNRTPPDRFVPTDHRVGSRQYNPRDFAQYALSALDEPVTYKQATSGPEAEQWKDGLKSEYDAIEKNGTWTAVRREPRMNVIKSGIVFKKKKDANGAVKQYKARIVAKGYSQQYGVDYYETFSPVLKNKSLRIIFALSVITENAILKQLDVKSAFLNATVNEDIYMELPDGFFECRSREHHVNTTWTPRDYKSTDEARSDIVLKLNKALYGIKQAPREWNKNISNFIKNELKFTQCVKDTCVYVKKSKKNNNIIIGLFVDDTVTSHVKDDDDEYNELIDKLKKKYEMSDLGEVSHILGMRVRREKDTLYIDQKVYVDEKLKQFKMNDCKTVTTPETLDKLTKNVDKNSIENEDEYRSIVGSLIYASVSTRPDITHAVNMVSRHMHEPNATHMNAAKRILRYLKESSDCGLVYTNTYKKSSHVNTTWTPRDHHVKNNEIIIEAFCDADWGGDLDDRKSTTGYCVFINGCLVSWYTHKQPTVALSSAEAELMGAVDVVKEIKWMKQMLEEMNFQVRTPVIVNIDNQSAMKIAENDVDHSRTKHIDIKNHFIKNEINDKMIELKWVATENQIADIFTKGLGYPTYNKLKNVLVSKV